jgi:hypothetical protein
MEESNKVSLGKLFCMPCCIFFHANLLAFCWLMLLPCKKTSSCNVLNNEQNLNLLHISRLLPLWVGINVIKTNLCVVLLIFDVWAYFLLDYLHFPHCWPPTWCFSALFSNMELF